MFRPMRILLWHGYLLSGSGSNIYTRAIIQRWRADGHHVVCMCQERHPESFDWIDRAVEVGRDSPFAPTEVDDGWCELVRPSIGQILPVYVYDRYEGFEAKRFVDLTDEELAEYNRLNIEAMTQVVETFRPDAIVTGHEVMGPYIAARSCGDRRYLAKLHGSALEYAVKEDPARFLPYASEGLGSAGVVVGGSRYMLEEAATVVPGWRARGRVVNPGVDIDLFRPIEREPGPRLVVGFVGKLISNKGVHDLLVALGLVSEPVELVIVGFGDMEDRLRALAQALSRGDRRAAIETLHADDPREAPARELLAGADGAAITERASRSRVRFTGRLEHEPLATVLPTFDTLVVPSVLAEAFGMVAAEAAACGVVPIVPDHSGIGEVGRTLEEDVGRPGSFTYVPELRSAGIAGRLDELAALPRPELREIGGRCAAVARERWSWGRCAADLLRLATEG
jgi:glycosyltransferase involved in cell wall biosynthesis